MNARALANVLLSSLFEPPCAACAQVLSHPLDGAVCERCWASVRHGIALDEHLHEPGAVDWVGAVGLYEGRLRDIVHALKYERRRSIARQLGTLMRTRGALLLNDADMVVPVPLHPRREHERGFNQAADLARQLGLPVISLLRRVRDTTSQIDLPADERHRNVRDAFRLTPIPDPRFHRRQGDGGQAPLPRVVVLVDDVTTTGATLEACAKELKRGGVGEVRALTAARVAIGRH